MHQVCDNLLFPIKHKCFFLINNVQTLLFKKIPSHFKGILTADDNFEKPDHISHQIDTTSLIYNHDVDDTHYTQASLYSYFRTTSSPCKVCSILFLRLAYTDTLSNRTYIWSQLSQWWYLWISFYSYTGSRQAISWLLWVYDAFINKDLFQTLIVTRRSNY